MPLGDLGLSDKDLVSLLSVKIQGGDPSYTESQYSVAHKVKAKNLSTVSKAGLKTCKIA